MSMHRPPRDGGDGRGPESTSAQAQRTDGSGTAAGRTPGERGRPIDRTHPNPEAVVAHVFVDPEGTGRCMCGQLLYTGVHVHNDGTPMPDLAGLAEALQAISDACQDGITLLLGGTTRVR